MFLAFIDGELRLFDIYPNKTVAKTFFIPIYGLLIATGCLIKKNFEDERFEED